MRIGPALVDALAGAAGEVMRFDRPAAAVLAAFFRSHRELGQHDRAFVAETVYAVLRRRRLVEFAATKAGVVSPTPRQFALAALVTVRGLSAVDLAAAVRSEESAWLEAVTGAARGNLPFSVECDLPDWIIKRLLPGMGEASLMSLARALNQPAPLDLRVNLVKADRAAVAARLAADGIAAAQTPYSPIGIRLAGKPTLHKHPLYTSGVVEVQDEGSQLLCYLLAPRRGEMVVDFCAGGGGKSLALGSLMRSSGRVYAFDVSEKRLAKLRPRLERSELSNVYPQRIASEGDPKLKRLFGKVDRVLVDAPCSGLGTLRRDPDLKWRQSEPLLPGFSRKQTAILSAAAALVKPSGRLLYATCSLLPEENENIVREFLDRRAEFTLIRPATVLEAVRIALPRAGSDDEFLRLRPDVHGTDGFFAALMERHR